MNKTDPSGMDSMCVSTGTCFGDPNDPDTAKREQRAGMVMTGVAAVGATALAWEYLAVPTAVAARNGVSWIGRAFGIGRVAAPTVEAAEAALPQGVTRQVFAKVGVWRTEGGVAEAATRSRAVSGEAIQGLKDAGVSRGAVQTWQKFYQGAIETVRSDGTKIINETARYRSEVLGNVLKGW